MNVYRIHPEYTQSGEHYAHWVDDGVRLMDGPHRKVGSVITQWPDDMVFELVRDGHDCDAYMNPSGLCFTQRAVDTLAPVCGSFAEWLPIQIVDGEPLFLFHPTSTVPLGADARFRSHQPGDNIVEIYDYDFDNPNELPCCFRIPQPETSPAGIAGYTCIGDYVTDTLYAAMGCFRGIDFAHVFPSKKRG